MFFCLFLYAAPYLWAASADCRETLTRGWKCVHFNNVGPKIGGLSPKTISVAVVFFLHLGLKSPIALNWSALDPVSTWMGDHLQVGKPYCYVTSHPGWLSLAIHPWVGTMSTSESWDVNRCTMRCTSPSSVVLQCKLVSGFGLRKWRSVSLYGLMARGGLYVPGHVVKFGCNFHVTDFMLLCLCSQNVKLQSKGTKRNSVSAAECLRYFYYPVFVAL